MRGTFFIWLNLFFWSTLMCAKAQRITYSDEIDLPKNAHFKTFSGEKYHYLLYQTSNEAILKIYDHRLKFKNDVVLDFIKGQVLTQYLFYHQHKLYSFWIRMNNKQVYFEVAILNPSGILESYKTYTLADISIQDWKNGSFQWQQSTQKDQLGFSFSNRRKGNLILVKYDLNQEELSMLSEELPRLKSSRTIVEEQLLITKNALVWIQKAVNTTWNEWAEPLHVYQWTNQSKQIESVALENNIEAFIGHQKVFYNEGEDKLYLGTLLTHKKNKLPQSVYIQEINQQRLNTIKVIDMEDYILKSLHNNQKKLDLFDFKIHDMAFMKDQGFFVGVQVQYLLLKNYALQNMIGFSMTNLSTKRVKEFYFGEYIGIQTHTEHTKNWQNILRKSQLTEEDFGYFSSVAVLNSGQQLLVFFNDLNHKRNQVQIGVLQPTGEVIYGQIPRTRLRPSYKVIPSLAYSNSPISIMMPIYYENQKLGLMLVDFTDHQTTHNK